MYLLFTIYFWQSKNMQSCKLWKSLKILWLIHLLQHELSRSDLDDLIYESIKSESDLSKMLMIWFMKVLNLSQIWVKSEQDVDDLIYESIKSESDLSQIWARCWWCYEHVWINQSSDLILINLIKANHDAMSSLNLAHFCWTLWVILSTSSCCSALSSFTSFIISLNKHIWHITSHLYRV